MNLQVIKNRVLLWLRKIFFYSLYIFVVISLLGFGILQIPSVQRALATRYLSRFSAVTGFDISLKSVYLLWYDRLEIEGLIVKDPEKNTMISSDHLSVNFSIANLFDNSNLNIDGAALDGTEVNLAKIHDSDTSKDLNINILISKLRGKSSGGGKSTKVNIGEIVVDKSFFSYDDDEKDSLRDQFDYNHFRLAIDDAVLQGFKVIGDTIQFTTASISAIDQATQFGIQNLSTFFRISQRSMEFLNVDLKTRKSRIADTVVFSYSSQRDLSDFNNKVSVAATLKNTVIDPNELALFAPAVESIANSIAIEGRFTGKVNRFFGRNTKIAIGNTVINGNLEMDGLPEINETFMNLRLARSQIDIRDLKFAFTDKLYKRLQPLEQFRIQGTFTGFVNDFVANAIFDGPIGRLNSDINLKINENAVERSTYSGRVELVDFDLGTYAGDSTMFQKVSLNGKISGKGFTEQTADFLLNGKVSSIGINGYNYSNITTNARFKSQFFNGEISVQDPNLKFKANGSINFTGSHESVRMDAQLDTIFFNKLGLTKENLFLSTSAHIDSKGLKLDSIFGDASFRNTFVAYRDKSLELDSIFVSSNVGEDSTRQLMFRSSLADINLEGDYFYSSLFNDMSDLFRELILTIKNDKAELTKYYERKRVSTQDYNARFQLELHNVNPLISLVNFPVSISKESAITGRFTNGYTSIFSAYSMVDSISINDKLFLGNEIEFNGSKIRDSTNVLAMLTVNSESQELGKKFITENLLMEGIWNKDHIEVGFDVDQMGYENSMRLKGEVDFLDDSTLVKILPSQIRVLNDQWMVDEDNYAVWSDGEWFVHNLKLSSGRQSVYANGFIAKDSTQQLTLDIQNLELDLINNFSTENFTGLLNGTAKATGLLSNPFVQNQVTITDFNINNFLIGDVIGRNEWNPRTKRFDIDFTIDRLNLKTVDLSGYYDPYSESPLQVNAQLQNASLKIAEPLLRGLFSQLDGTATGAYTVTGTFGEPQIRGEATIKQGQLIVDYLKTQYNFTGRLKMTPAQIQFHNFDVSDFLGNKASLEGHISHKNFREFGLNLDGSFRNFQILNTTTKDNSLFYGQGYATGNLTILGPSDNLKISATAKTEKNTRIYIPIDDSEDVEKKDFLNFVNFTDTAAKQETKVEVKKKTESAGLTMDLNLDITQDAYAEIIFDIKTGEIIRGRGNGEIKLQLDTKGDFNMFGVLEFTQGAYNFTLYDIINKEFDIKPGSRISWFGDPYEGQLDITATYRQLASLVPILSQQYLVTETTDGTNTTVDPQLRRKYPAEVELKLEGRMLQPRISFDIFARDLPQNIDVNGRNVSLNFEFQAFKARLDEQELKRQVFSLIVLRRFSPPDAFNTSGTITNSVSEFLSNQLSYWLTQVDQNLEIDLDIGSLDAEAFNTFQLRLSYSFLNGRLRVTKDGTFSNQYRASDNVSTIAGDWTVDYLLTSDGKLRIKMYSRSNYNQINSQLGTQSAVTTGVSLMHTQNFNEFKELLRSTHEKRRKEALDEDSPAPDEGSNQ